MSTWSHLPNEKAFGPQKLTVSLNWIVQHLRNRNILFHSSKRAYWCQNVLPYQLSSWRMLLHKPSTRRIPTKLVRQTNWKFAKTSNENCWYMSWNILLNMWACQLSRCPSMAPSLQKKSCLPNEKAFTKMKHLIISPLYNLGDQIIFFQVNITLHAWLKIK